MSLITISQSLGSGGITIAKQVAEGLDIELYDDARLQQEAIAMGIGSQYLEGMDEKVPGLFDRILGKNPDIYLDLMEAVVYKVSQSGQGVIMGHGGQMLLRDFGCALHVRIFASNDRRISNLQESQRLDGRSAEKIIRKSDNRRKGFFRYAFDIDLNDPTLYDLIINTEKIGNDLASQMIVKMAASDQIGACSLTATDAMERLSLAKKVEAELLKNGISISMLHVEAPDKGSIYVRGLAINENEKQRIKEVVGRMTEISQSQTDVGVVTGSV
jgi:cytidylate kinase